MSEGGDSSACEVGVFNQRGYHNANANANAHLNFISPISYSHITSVDVFSGSHGGVISPAALRPDPFSNSNRNLNSLYSGGGGGGGRGGGDGVGAASSGGGGEGSLFSPPLQQTTGSMACKEPLTKKKRGRPRKFGNDGLISLMLSDKDKFKRGGEKKTQMAALGSAGHGFTPHIMQIARGEDVFEKILAFLQHGTGVVCVLSAKGAISNVTVTKKTYKGQFEIHSLSGSFLSTEVGGSPIGGLSVCFVGPDGYIVGGAVPGRLMAASSVQVVVGTFLVDSKKLIAGTGNGEICSGTITASISELPPPGATLQSTTEAFCNSSAGQKGHSDQNPGSHGYAQQIHVLNITSLHPVAWVQPQFEAQMRSNPDATMTGGVSTMDQDNGYQSEDKGEDHINQSGYFNN